MYEDDAVYLRFGEGMTRTVKAIIAVTAGVFLLQLVTGLAASPGAADPFSMVFALVPSAVFERFQAWRLLTYAFLHGGPFHVLFNMLAVYFFAPGVERNLGSGRHFLFFYLAAAFTGGICQAVLSLLLGADVPIIGASAAVMGIIAAAAVYTPDQPVILFIFPMRLKHLALIFVGADVVFMLQEIRAGTGHVARLAHLGGAAFGFLYVVLLPRLHRLSFRFRRARAARREKRAADAEAELDRILRKIKEQGLSSLTRRERTFLMKRSREMRDEP